MVIDIIKPLNEEGLELVKTATAIQETTIPAGHFWSNEHGYSFENVLVS